MEHTPTDYFLTRICRNIMSNNERNPVQALTPYWEQYDSELFNNYCAENDDIEVPDYVSSAVIQKIKEYYEAKNLCFKAFLEYKKAKEAYRVVNRQNQEKSGEAHMLEDRTREAFWRSQDNMGFANTAVRNAINASNEGTLGPRNIATSGLRMENRNRAEAAQGAFSPRRAAVPAAAVPAAQAAVPSGISRADELQLVRAKAQLKHLGRPPTNAEVALELKKVQRFNAMQKGRKGGKSRKSRKSRKNRKTRRT